MMKSSFRKTDDAMSLAASFQIEFLQYLNPDGTSNGRPLPELAKDTGRLVELFKQMLFVRVFDTKSIALQRTGKLGTYASCLGHEATHVGIGASMRPQDVFAPSYREYGAQFMRGVKPREVLLYWGGDERGNDFEVPRQDFSWSVPISTQCLHAAGAALAFKLRGEDRVAVSTCGDGGSSKTDFYAALNSAGAYQLPLVLGVVNNGWAISVPRSAQTGAANPGAEGPGRRPVLPAGGRQRPDRRARCDGPGHAARAQRPGRHGAGVRHLSPVRPHHRRRRPPLPRRGRGQGRLGTRPDPAHARLADRAGPVGRGTGKRLEGRSAGSAWTKRSTRIWPPRCSRWRRCSTTSTPTRRRNC